MPIFWIIAQTRSVRTLQFPISKMETLKWILYIIITCIAFATLMWNAQILPLIGFHPDLHCFFSRKWPTAGDSNNSPSWLTRRFFRTISIWTCRLIHLLKKCQNYDDWIKVDDIEMKYILVISDNLRNIFVIYFNNYILYKVRVKWEFLFETWRDFGNFWIQRFCESIWFQSFYFWLRAERNIIPENGMKLSLCAQIVNVVRSIIIISINSNDSKLWLLNLAISVFNSNHFHFFWLAYLI